MVKKLILLYLTLALFSCSRITVKNNLNGNWYSSSSELLEDNTIDYVEVFIKNDTIHLCSEYMGRMSPRKMFLKNDSLFLNSKSDSNFIGKIIKYSKNKFDLGLNNVNKRTYYKIRSSKNLENLINAEISERDYYSEFQKRMNDRYKELGIE